MIKDGDAFLFVMMMLPIKCTLFGIIGKFPTRKSFPLWCKCKLVYDWNHKFSFPSIFIISNSRVYFTRLSMLSTCCFRQLSIHIHCMWLTESVIFFPSMALKIFVPTNPNQGLYFDYYFAPAIPLLLLTKIISSSARLMLVNSSYAYTANILLRFNKVK